MKTFIKRFSDTRIGDVAEVGGKNASLGEMYNNLVPKGIRVPDGFSINVAAFRDFLSFNELEPRLQQLLLELDRKEFTNLEETGAKARSLIMNAKFPTKVEDAIISAYTEYFGNGNQEVAVRSSATAEDLADASFAGQHDSFLNIKGPLALVYAVKCCFASLYTDRAIKYREDKGFEHSKVYISVGVQRMVRSDLACSGIGFTLEPESGFRDVVHLAGTWGLGEYIVQGTVTPDEFLVFKPALLEGKYPIIQKNLGSKNRMLVYNDNAAGTNSTLDKTTPRELRTQFVLSEAEIQQLAQWGMMIEQHYGRPMDFEWAKDGIDQQLYIIQARPETIHSRREPLYLTSYTLAGSGEVLATGQAIGSAIVSGRARIIRTPQEANKIEKGDILITENTSPDWDPILKKVAGIVTNKGGRTSHASIIARELGAAAIVGTGNGTSSIKDGELITVCCAEGKTGRVYRGEIPFKKAITDLSSIKLPDSPRVQLIVGEPERAFELSSYPAHGVGLMRLEFIINNYVRIHPMALLQPEKVNDTRERALIEQLTILHENKCDYFVERLAQGVATIAAAFYPREVIVRMSDFKSNEYAGLLGGHFFEPQEENPMIGFRGASRYYHDNYKEGFRLECEAMKRVRDVMGLTNVKLMIPFCRTVEEGRKVVSLMKEYGLEQHKGGLEIYVMAEIPSNVLLAEGFAAVFDGFSIGSNDLTQLTLGIDRDSELVAGLFNEQDAASYKLIKQMIKKARKLNKKVGLCGQAASDSEDFTAMLVNAGIDSISFNPDALMKGIDTINKVKEKSKLSL
jgi:pyruvate,water dikinase